jgi:hypothetical protein
MQGGFPGQQLPDFDEQYQKFQPNGFAIAQVVPDSSTDFSSISAENYGNDGYLNHMHINYDGGDNGESYFTGPDSDITFMDIITPMVLEGHS